MSRDFNQKDEIEIVEKRKIKRITFGNFVASIFDAFNLERGLIFTIKRLFKNPGKAVSDYLSTGRFNYTPPFRLLLVTTTLIILVLSFSRSGSEFMSGFTSEIDNDKIVQDLKFLGRFLNLIFWIFIPIIAFFQWLFNRRSGYNYAEMLVFHTYIYSIINLISLILVLDYFINGAILTLILMVGSSIYYIISYKSFMKKSWGRAIWEMIVIGSISTFIYTVIIIGLIAGIIILELGLPEVDI
ncbi:DUF3667 domain-containing protein [Halocola ammonii]